MNYFSYPVWKHIAIKKLELPMDVAWMYFTTYDLIGGDTEPEDRIEWDRRFSMCSTATELGECYLFIGINFDDMQFQLRTLFCTVESCYYEAIGKRSINLSRLWIFPV